MIQNFVSLSTLVHVLPVCGTFGRAVIGDCQHHPQRVGIPFMIAMAFVFTCGSLVSNLIGAGEQDLYGELSSNISVSDISFALPILVFFCLFPDLILRIYTDIPDLRAASVPSLWVLCSAYLVLVLANVYFQSVSGNRKYADCIGYGTLCTGYLCHILCIFHHVSCEWMSHLPGRQNVYGTFILLFCYWYMKKGNWQKKKI